MTTRETAMILATLRAAYPSFYRDMSHDDVTATASLWHGLFADEDYTVVSAAVQALIKTRTNTYPPVPGEVTEQIHKLTHPDELSAQDAWALVKQAASRGLYNAQEEYDRLPPSVQHAVGSPAQLRAWAETDPSTFETVVASNFRRAYEARRASDRELEALPSGAREVMQTIAAGVFKSLPEVIE